MDGELDITITSPMELFRLVESIYWKCKRHSSCASGPAAHHLAHDICTMIENELVPTTNENKGHE